MKRSINVITCDTSASLWPFYYDMATSVGLTQN